MIKKIVLLAIPLFVLAKSQLLSNIPLPSVYIINLNTLPCNDKCLSVYLDQKKIFSFLANTKNSFDSDMEIAKVDYSSIKSSYLEVAKTITPQSTNKIKIALLLPHKTIGKYATSTTNATLAYLILKNYPFDVKSYKTESESVLEIQRVLDEIKSDGYNYIIAPLTKTGEASLSQISTNQFIYIPTINKKDATSTSHNILYGGIDYQAQSQKLLNHMGSKLVIFEDGSAIGKQLTYYQESMVKNSNPAIPVRKYTLPPKDTNLKSMLDGNGAIGGASLFINTPIVKSALVLSQLTLYDIKAENILSIQTNYTPLLFSMTQYRDRKNIIIANSISQNSDEIVEINSLLDNDISYDWINYTTTVGVDYLAYLTYRSSRDYNVEVKNNEIIYPIELITTSNTKFIPYGSGE